MYAVQFYKQMLKDIPKAEELISKQDFGLLIKWLRKHIHSKGRTMLIEDMCKKATGKGLDVNEFIEYLEEKYRKIYKF